MSIERKRSGFTLVEILIVVIILGILAAIIIPQFSDASNEARESTLTSNLQILRSQVGLYKIQHLDNYPVAPTAAFETSLTTQTEEDGTAWVSGPALGPYMQKVPDNPFATTDVKFVFDSVTDGTSHWNFDTTTGAITANDDQDTPDGDNHDTL